MAKKILSVLCAAFLLFGGMAVSAVPALAAAQDKALQTGTAGIDDPVKTENSKGTYYTPSDYVWFGSYAAMYGTAPLKWRVLDADKTNAGTDGMFLLSESLMKGDIPFNEDTAKKNVWQGSDAQAWCAAFTSANLTAAEKAVLLSVSKSDEKKEGLYSNNWGESALVNDEVFFLSAGELADYVGNYSEAPGLGATRVEDNAGKTWWLRSPKAYESGYAAIIRSSGQVTSAKVDSEYTARPALNVDLKEVLFTSAAVDGKVSGAVGADALQAVADYTGNEWKLTLLDDSRSAFTAETTAGNQGLLTVVYKNAVPYHAETAPNEYISAIIVDADGTITHYGRLLQPAAASGTLQVDVSAIDMTGKTLKIFAEQYNGNKATDLASQPVAVSHHVCAGHGDWFSDDGINHYRLCPCGAVMDMGAHDGGTATCADPAVCQICSMGYGEKDKENHVGGTEVRDAVEATQTETGYTGDTYCLGCGEKLQTGTVIPVAGTPTPPPQSPNTGDGNYALAWLLPMLLGAAGLVLVLLGRSRAYR